MTKNNETQQENGLLREQIWFKVLLGLILGVIAGSLMGPDLNLMDQATAGMIGEWLALPGQIFLTILKFIVVPLVLASVMLGIADGNDSRAVGTLGVGIVYFIITTTIAILMAFTVTSFIEPGSQIAANQASEIEVNVTPPDLTGRSLPETITSAIPTNIAAHWVNAEMLQVVIAAAIFGLALIRLPNSEGRPIMDLMRSTQNVCMTIVLFMMDYAPIVVFGLIADTVISRGFSAVIGVSTFFINVVLVLTMMIVVYMVLVWLIAGRNPFQFIKDSRETMLLAFSTSSSAATMPVTLRTTETRHKVRSSVGGLVIPLGTTVNMDGTGIYQAICAMFIAQAYGIDLTTIQMLSIILLAIAGSIGSPGLPSAGIPVLAAILASQGIPVEGLALILGVERLLDMARTVVNVTGDMTAAVVLDKLLGTRFDRKYGTSVDPGIEESG